MIDALMGIVDFIGTIIQLLSNTLASVIWAISALPQFTATLGSMLAYCPLYLVAWIEISIALTVLFAVLKLMH